VANRGDADLPASVGAIRFREAGITLLHFRGGVLDQEVQQIVYFAPKPFASRTLDEGFSSLTAVGSLIAELPRGGVRQRDHLIRKMDRILRLPRVTERAQRLT